MADKAGQALHVLDRFHITMHLNRAVDQVRRGESARLRGKPTARRLKKMHWTLLRRHTRVRGKARKKLNAVFEITVAGIQTSTRKQKGLTQSGGYRLTSACLNTLHSLRAGLVA